MTINPQNYQAIVHCPKCAATPLSWLTPKSFTCKKCGFVMFLNIAAAVGVIIECKGSLLFGVRKHEPGKGMLTLPGGFADPGEPGEAAALREVREETGIELQQIQYLCSFPNCYHYRDLVYDTLDLVYCCCLPELPQMQADDDLDELLWIDRECIPFERIAFVSLRKAVQRYLGVVQG